MDPISSIKTVKKFVEDISPKDPRPIVIGRGDPSKEKREIKKVHILIMCKTKDFSGSWRIVQPAESPLDSVRRDIKRVLEEENEAGVEDMTKLVCIRDEDGYEFTEECFKMPLWLYSHRGHLSLMVSDGSNMLSRLVRKMNNMIKPKSKL